MHSSCTHVRRQGNSTACPSFAPFSAPVLLVLYHPYLRFLSFLTRLPIHTTPTHTTSQPHPQPYPQPHPQTITHFIREANQPPQVRGCRVVPPSWAAMCQSYEPSVERPLAVSYHQPVDARPCEAVSHIVVSRAKSVLQAVVVLNHCDFACGCRQSAPNGCQALFSAAGGGQVFDESH